MLQKGDRVQLTAEGTSAMRASGGAPKRRHAAWEARAGTLVSIGRPGARVIWDGCRTPCDGLPVRLLQPVKGAS